MNLFATTKKLLIVRSSTSYYTLFLVKIQIRVYIYKYNYILHSNLNLNCIVLVKTNVEIFNFNTREKKTVMQKKGKIDSLSIIYMYISFFDSRLAIKRLF